MSTAIGHALAGAAVFAAASPRIPESRRRTVALATITAAVLPDVDVALLLVWGERLAPHRGLSHSLLATAVLSASLAYALSRSRDLKFSRAFGVFLAASLSHLLLDWAMGTGPEIRLFAPLDLAGYLAPARLVPTAYYARNMAGYASPLFWFGNALALALEILLFAPLVISLRRESTSRLRVLACATSAAAFIATYGIFN